LTAAPKVERVERLIIETTPEALEPIIIGEVLEPEDLAAIEAEAAGDEAAE
jgi:hypothetical protein